MDQILSPETFLRDKCAAQSKVAISLFHYTNRDRCGAKNTAKTFFKSIPNIFVTYLRKPLATVL